MIGKQLFSQLAKVINCDWGNFTFVSAHHSQHFYYSLIATGHTNNCGEEEKSVPRLIVSEPMWDPH